MPRHDTAAVRGRGAPHRTADGRGAAARRPPAGVAAAACAAIRDGRNDQHGEEGPAGKELGAREEAAGARWLHPGISF
eukprot:gene1737-683_t